MESKTYYGEYSLKHWIRLILSRNIILPDYQRSFVWQEKDIKRLMTSFNDKQFVQPVTIAQYKPATDSPSQNLILDGQQRLTSILLAYLGYFPEVTKFSQADKYTNEDDSVDQSEESTKAGPIQWTFKNLLNTKNEENTKDKIAQKLKEDGKYKTFNISFEDSFFEQHFLGFSYIVPATNSIESEIQLNFTKIFRNMNYFGKRLSCLESRRSLYYMNKEYKSFFDGVDEDGHDILCGLSITENLRPSKIDFVKYLSLLSQYSITQKTENIMKRYSAYSSRESFYADYICYILKLDQESVIDKFNGFELESTFPDNCWKERFKIVEESIERILPEMKIEPNRSFASSIDADYWLFGLLYYVLFMGKKLIEDIGPLQDRIKHIIQVKKINEVYSKSPNKLGYLRERIDESIKLYSDYVL